jgi:diacylglycerol O-acyltransferase / wax synthase
MSPADRNHSLSWGDTFFLYLEREGQPLNIASTCEFEGKISKLGVTKFIESKLELIPRYKQRAIFPSFNLGLPSWEPDPTFDIRNHVHEVVLKQGTDNDLKAETAKVISSTLDRNHPLWDLTLIRGLQGNRTGLIIRLHHCMADGISGVGIMNVLLDASPDPPKLAPAKKKTKSPELARPTDSVAMVLDRLLKSYQSFMQGALIAQTEVASIAREVLAGAAHGHTEELIHLVPELASVTERFPFNQVCRGPQQIAWGEIPMADIKAIRESCGGTVNDVVLTVITSTVRRYAEQHGVKVRGRHLRLIIPINVRGDGHASELGNKITFLPVNVPLDVRDPRALLARISERVVFLRSVGVPEMVGMFGMLLSKIPLPVQAAVVPVLTQLPLSLANMICTNVPGPQLPLYLMGHKLLRCYPYVPIGGVLGVNVAILSYNGVAYVGFGGDVFAVPDIERFEDMLRASFAELRDAAAGKPAPTKTAEKSARPTGRPRPIERTATKAAPRAAKPKVKRIVVERPTPPKRRTAAAAAAVPIPSEAANAVARVEAQELTLAHAGD